MPSALSRLAFLLPLGLLCYGPTATAAELEVALDKPVMVYVDGKPLENTDGSMNIGIGDLGAGRHIVEVRNLVGKRITELTVDLAADEVVRLRYRDKTLSEIGRGPSAATAAAVADAEASAAEAEARAAEAEARAAEAEARAAQAEAAAAGSAAAVGASVGAQAGGVSLNISISGMPDDMPAGFGATVGLSSAVQGSGGRDVASAAFAGIDPQLFRITLDGRDVAWVPHMAAFVAPALRPGTVPFVLYLNGKRALSADFTTTAGRHSACMILVEPFDYKTSCADGGRALLRSDLGGGHGGFPPAQPPPPVEPPAPQPMAEGALVGLIAAVEGASFSDDQVSVLATAAAGNHFTCAQVVRLIEPISFGDSKVEAVTAMRHAILDPQNAFQLEQAFSFSSDKEEVRALFR